MADRLPAATGPGRTWLEATPGSSPTPSILLQASRRSDAACPSQASGNRRKPGLSTTTYSPPSTFAAVPYLPDAWNLAAKDACRRFGCTRYATVPNVLPQFAPPRRPWKWRTPGTGRNQRAGSRGSISGPSRRASLRRVENRAREHSHLMIPPAVSAAFRIRYTAFRWSYTEVVRSP